MLKCQGNSSARQMIENHPRPSRLGRAARLAWAARRPTPPLARPARPAAATPRGATRRVKLLPLLVRPFGFLAKVPEAGR